MSPEKAAGAEGRSALNEQFYREYREDLLYAAGLDDRFLDLDDHAAMEEAFRALGWTSQQQRMFADGAPKGSISSKLRGAIRKAAVGRAQQAA